MRSTRFVSRAASRSIGKMKRKKKTDRMAKPFAARVYAGISLTAAVYGTNAPLKGGLSLPQRRDQLRISRAHTVWLQDPNVQ